MILKDRSREPETRRLLADLVADVQKRRDFELGADVAFVQHVVDAEVRVFF